LTEKEQNEQKKEYLNSYKNLCKKLRSLEEQIQSLRIAAESAKVQSITDMPMGNKQTDLSDYMVQLEVVFTKIIQMKADCMKKRIEIEIRIADMPDGIESSILHKRYIEFKPWENICVEIDYSWMQTHRYHGMALRNFKMVN